MGLIKWLKKDSQTRLRRRESAPTIQSHEKFDPNRTCDDSYRQKLAKFNQFRTEERIQRLSMGPNDMSGYHTILDDQIAETEFSTSEVPVRQQPQRKPNKLILRRANATTDEELDDDTLFGDRPKSKKISVQFHLNESTDESELDFTRRRAPRHSMPASSQHVYKHKSRRSKNSFNSHTILEEEIKEFEGAHCYSSTNDDDERQSGYRSPPMKFYKQNSNPYPSNDSDSTAIADTKFKRAADKCPEKPKRLYVNSNHSRKLLTDAHFTGAYKNFEIQSPYFSEDSSTQFSFTALQEKMQEHRRNSRDSLLGDNSSQSTRYQVIVNKHGDEVEYALPCVDQQPQYLRRQKPPEKPLTSDDSIMANEVFQEDPNECRRIIDGNFDLDSIASEPSVHDRSEDFLRKRGRIMITDLDKSTDSANTLDDIRSTAEHERHKNELNGIAPRATNRVLEFYETMQCADVICLISECRTAIGEEPSTRSPLFHVKGNFKQTPVTVRKYTDNKQGIEDEQYKDFALLAETAIIRDLDVLRKIRHPNVVNLMAIAFEPFHRVALIMEPTKYTLNHLLYRTKENIDSTHAVQIVKKMASAALYLQEFGFCHSNISPHSILITDVVPYVKLSSFELAVPYKSDIQNEVELKTKQKVKRTPSDRRSKNQSPNKLLTNEEKVEKYKRCAQSNAKNTVNHNYSIPFIRNINVKYLPYCLEYRQQLSEFNYQAPELLSRTENFVFPNKHSDVYALALLLWELINRYVPFAIHTKSKLPDLFEKTSPFKLLPVFDGVKCEPFRDIFEFCLQTKPTDRFDLAKLISKLDSVEIALKSGEVEVTDKGQCYCMKVSKEQYYVRRATDASKNENVDENVPTPDRSTSKQLSIIKSPKPSPINGLSVTSAEKNVSPMNNVANTTLYRSILDFNKLLSPRRVPNANDIYERSSTLKRRKKLNSAKQQKQNESFSEMAIEDDATKTPSMNNDFSPRLSGNSFSDLNKALTKSTISKALEYSNNEDDEDSVGVTGDAINVISPINANGSKTALPNDKKPFNNVVADSENSTKPNNSSYQFIIDDYELPNELIARNNKIRRCTWLSSDQVNTTNTSTQYECPKVVASSTQTKYGDEIARSPSLNESIDNKKVNVSIKIVHKQLSPVQSVSHNESMKSDCTTLSADSSEESFSVKSRIKFFRSLENPPVQRRNLNRHKSFISRRSDVSFNDAKKAIEKIHRHTFPAIKPSSKHDDEVLIREISDITAEIKKCLERNTYLNGKGKKLTPSTEHLNNLINSSHAVDKSMAMFIDEILNHRSLENSKSFAAHGEEEEQPTEKRNSVRETVQKFESSIQNERLPFAKIENKLLNDKVINTEPKASGIDDVMVEKVEEVMRIEAPSETENEAGTPYDPATQEIISNETTENHQTQTLIKRTFYQESIISGTNVEMPELKELLLTPTVQTTYATTTKSSMTTCVTLNMRKLRRRSSDVGLLAYQRRSNGGSEVSSPILTPRFSDVRHSIGSPLPEKEDGDLSAAQISCSQSTLLASNEHLQSSISSANRRNGIFNSKKIQSIEDLYIDDDFAGMSLAANMKLMTNSIDSLDNIDFDLISTRIFEQTSESMMATAITATNSLPSPQTNAIEDDAIDKNS